MQKLKETKGSLDLPSFLISGGILLIFILTAVINADFVANTVDYLFGLSATYFVMIYQIALLCTFFIALFLGFSIYGKIRLGNLNKLEISTFKWISIIMCIMFSAVGVFLVAA